MKILYILDKPNLYGSELHVLGLIEYFKEYHVEVITFSDGPLIERIKEKGKLVHTIKMDWIPSLRKFRKLIEKIKLISPDFIHAHQPKAGFLGGICAKILSIKLIYTVHSLPGGTGYYRKTLFMKVMVTLFHCCIQFIAEFISDRSLFVSETSRKTSFFKKKSIVIYNWINNKNKICNRLELNFPIKILSIGSIDRGKGFDLLTEFLSMIDPNSFILEILGTGKREYVQNIQEKFKKSGINVKFVGYVKDVGSYYSKADIFVLFSRSETFGLVYAEAASYGLPIFARNLPVLREILPCENFLSNDLEYLSACFFELTKNINKYNYISNINQKWAEEKFSYEKNVASIEEVYNIVLNK
jgi:glycosyltransferase involved in cell wall biosynthesis